MRFQWFRWRGDVVQAAPETGIIQGDVGLGWLGATEDARKQPGLLWGPGGFLQLQAQRLVQALAVRLDKGESRWLGFGNTGYHDIGSLEKAEAP